MEAHRNIDRPHIVWALFPPAYWMFWGGLGLLVSFVFLGQEGSRGIVAVYAIGFGCAVGGIFAGSAFRRVCGYFEARASSDK